MKRVSTEDPAVVAMPNVLRVEPIRVQPQPVVVVFDIENVQVAVRVRICTICHHCHCPSIRQMADSRDCIEFGVLKLTSILHQVSSFLGSVIQILDARLEFGRSKP